jgi:hypothetical protein
MAFSMPSYFLGVGTVVGALTLGFGGGVLLTKTAIKESPAGPSRIERAARAEPMPAAPVVVTEAKAVPVPRADPPAAQPAPEPAPQVQATVAEPAKPVAEASKQEPAQAAEPARQAEAPKQAEPRQAEAPKQIEQREAAQWVTAREQRRAERRAERERRYAERKARSMEYARMRQRPADAQDQPARPELAFEREEPRPNLFEGLFGRPDTAPADKE